MTRMLAGPPLIRKRHSATADGFLPESPDRNHYEGHRQQLLSSASRGRSVSGAAAAAGCHFLPGRPRRLLTWHDLSIIKAARIKKLDRELNPSFVHLRQSRVSWLTT